MCRLHTCEFDGAWLRAEASTRPLSTEEREKQGKAAEDPTDMRSQVEFHIADVQEGDPRIAPSL